MKTRPVKPLELGNRFNDVRAFSDRTLKKWSVPTPSLSTHQPGSTSVANPSCR